MNPATATPPRILLVEDDADTARQLENLLRAANFQLIGSVSTGQAALRLAESTRPDLVIMDIVLPGELDGIQTATLLAERQDIPVLYLTAYSDEELYERARATSPLAYVHKPVDERELKRAIEVALDRHELLCRLKASQAHLAEAQAVAHLGSWRWDIAQDRVDASDELLRLLDLEAGSFEPRVDTFYQLACTEDRPRLFQAMETLLDGGDPGDVDIRLDCAENPSRVLRLRGATRFDATQKPVALTGTARDVSEEWRARREAAETRGLLESKVAERTAELWRNEERYRGLIDNLPDAVLVMLDNRVLFANPAASRLLAFPAPAALLGASTADLVYPEYWPTCEQCKHAALAGQSSNLPVFFKMRRADGGSVDVESLTFSYEYEGQPSVLAVMHDITYRRAIEQAAERFRVALDSSPDAVCLIDPERMRFLDVNATACTSLRYSREELLRMGPQDIKPHFNKDMLRARFAAVIAGEPEAEIFQTVHQRKDGSTFPVELRLSPFVSAGQTLIVAVARDISERIRAEAELRETHARFQQLAGNIDEAFWIRDLVENRFLYANPAYERLYGKSVDSLYRHPRSFLASVHPEDRDRIAAVYDALSAQPSALDLEYRVVIDEQVRWLWVRTFPIHAADGKAYRSIGLAQDVTHRRESEEQYRNIIQTSMDGFWLTNAQGRLLDCNEAYSRMMGYSREALLTLSVTDLEAKESAVETAKHIRMIMEQGYDRFESQHRHKDGHLIELEISAYFRPDAQGGRIFSFLRDITERKRAERALRESEARFSTVFHAAPIGIAITQLKDGRMVDTNQAMMNMMGYGRDEVLGRTTLELNIWPQPEQRAEIVERLRQLGRLHNQELSFRRKDGSLGNGLVSMEAIDLAGEPHLLSQLVDISERKRAEAELKLASERLTLAVRAAHVGIWDWDVPNDKLIWDDAMYRIYGVTREGFSGAYAAWEAGLHPDDLHRTLEASRLALSGEKDFDAEFRVVWPDQSIHHVQGNAVVLHDEAGKPLRMIGTNWDITERKEMEAALRKERDTRQRYLDTAQTLLVALDNQGRITMVNRKACELLGYREDELLGRNWLETCLPQTAHEVIVPVMEQILAGDLQPVEFFENPVLCRDGSQHLIAWHNSHLSDAQGNIIGILGSGEDITERKRAEQALIESEERYRAVVEDQTELICRLLSDGTLAFVNAVFCRFFGKREDELIGTTWRPCAHPDDVAMIEAKLATLSPSNPVVLIENRVTSGLGEVHWLQFVNRAFFDDAGRLTQIQAVARDITDRKNAELALQAAENFKQAVLDAVNTQVAVLDAAGNIVDVNAAWRRFAAENARAADEPVANCDIGSNYLSVCEAATGISSEGARAVTQGIRAVLAGEREFFRHEYPCHAPYQQRWFELSVTPLKGAAGGVVVSHSDITAPRLLAEELRQTEARTRSILRAAPVGISVLVERVFQEVNDTMLSMTGYTREELVGQSARMLYPTQADFDYVGTEKYRQIHAHGIGSVETRWQRKDGKIIDIALSSSPIMADDLSLGVTFSAQDITASKRAEQERLRHEASQREALVREVHHRIKNNLQGVIGLLRQDIADHPLTQPALESAIAQINTIAVVHGLQSRMPQNELRLRELLHEVCGAAAALAMPPQRPALNDALSGDVWLDSNASVSVALILNELIHNALKHSPPADGAGVTISLSGDGQHATVRIINPGGPLPANFDLASGTGCGTGLNLIRTLLPRHGATLKIFAHDGCIETELVLGPPLTTESELPSSPLDNASNP